MPTFSKQERLKSRKIIGGLFKEGNSFVAYPLRVVWLPVVHDQVVQEAEEFAASVAITVPKKTFKTAVSRNQIKRLVREAYRLHKHELYEKLADRRVALMLMYIAKEELPFVEIESGVRKMIRKFPV